MNGSATYQPITDLVGSGGSGTSNNSGLVQAFQNFQMPAGAAWQVAPTLQNITAGDVPSLISIDPSMYSDVFNTANPRLNTYTDPTSGQSVPVNPWMLDPNYQEGGRYGALNPLIVSPAIPAPGGKEDLKAGTYSDPADTQGAAGTFYNFNLGTGNATPTEQSLQETYQSFLAHQIPGWGQFLMGLPEQAFLGVMTAGAGSLLGAASAGSGAAGGGLLGGVGGSSGGLLSDISSAYQTLKPALTVAKTAIGLEQALNPPKPSR